MFDFTFSTSTTPSLTISTILGSAVISAIISGAFAWFNYTRNKKSDLLFDYKKYILDKRKVAYEIALDLINELDNSIREAISISPQKHLTYAAIFRKTDTNPHPTYDYVYRLATFNRHNKGWLSPEMYKCLTDAKNLIHTLLDHQYFNPYTEEF